MVLLSYLISGYLIVLAIAVGDPLILIKLPRRQIPFIGTIIRIRIKTVTSMMLCCEKRNIKRSI
jgi:hypothetical protein